MLTVLISSAGRRVGLIEAFRADANRMGMKLRVVAIDSRPELSAACQSADASFKVPRLDRDNYLAAVSEICVREHVDLLVPTIDTELALLSANADALAALGTSAVVSSPSVIALARDKLRTAEAFSAAGANVPRTAMLGNLLADPEGWKWPVILKPVGGSSSVGIEVARSIDEAKRLAANRNDFLAQEQWFGREYTVNMYFDGGGVLRCAIPHWRIETRGGEVSKGRTERVPALEKAARTVASSLNGARGALCFQAIVDETGRAGIFELNARFGGGYPLAHRAGARFSQWLLEAACGLPSTAGNDWVEGITMLRYDAGIFLPSEL